MGTNKWGPVICRTVVLSGPGDDPEHELVVLVDPSRYHHETGPQILTRQITDYKKDDQVTGTGTHRGYFIRLHKNGDTDYGTYEGTDKTTFKEDGSWENVGGDMEVHGGTGGFKNTKGSGTDGGKATAREDL